MRRSKKKQIPQRHKEYLRGMKMLFELFNKANILWMFTVNQLAIIWNLILILRLLLCFCGQTTSASLDSFPPIGCVKLLTLFLPEGDKCEGNFIVTHLAHKTTNYFWAHSIATYFFGKYFISVTKWDTISHFLFKRTKLKWNSNHFILFFFCVVVESTPLYTFLLILDTVIC